MAIKPIIGDTGPDFYDPPKYWENSTPLRQPGMHVDAAPPDGDTHLIFLAGAIKFWWLSKCENCHIVDERDKMVGSICTYGVGPAYAHVWTDFWGSPDHQQYVEHRNKTRAALIDAGYLTYAPHEAFKGRWTEAAQQVNDAAIRVCSAFVVLSPREACGVPVLTVGTDDELRLAQQLRKVCYYHPPTDGCGFLVDALDRALHYTL